jgi:hypothetical protein
VGKMVDQAGWYLLPCHCSSMRLPLHLLLINLKLGQRLGLLGFLAFEGLGFRVFRGGGGFLAFESRSICLLESLLLLAFHLLQPRFFFFLLAFGFLGKRLNGVTRASQQETNESRPTSCSIPDLRVRVCPLGIFRSFGRSSLVSKAGK